MTENQWLAYRDDPDKACYAGWRQHWLQMWGFIGQQYYIDYIFKDVIKTLFTMNMELEELRKR